MKTERVLIGCPMHDWRMDSGTARGLWGSASQNYPTIIIPNAASMTATNCNSLWSIALNERENNVKWFAMLHSDVDPCEWWIDKLIAEAEAHGADVVSAVIPIKDQRGITSTAISDPGNDWLIWFRLTLKQVLHEDFPKTFDVEDAARALRNLPPDLFAECPQGARLMANTGCMVCRIDRPWVEKTYFANRDAIKLVNGKFIPVSQCEDWFFTRLASQNGARVMATTKVSVIHKGVTGYVSDKPWGNKIDTDCIALRKTIEQETSSCRQLEETAIS